MPTYGPLHHVVVAVDAAGSGGRDDQLLLGLRAGLRHGLLEALDRPGLEVDEWIDLGDGVLLIMAIGVPPTAVLEPFINRLDAALRRHRRLSSEAARIRLRMAVHMGLLHRDAGGWTGAPLVRLARLLDADPPRRALADQPDANLVVILSDAVYDGLVRHGFGLDARACLPLTIQAKETLTTAWLHMPGSGRAPLSDAG